MSMEDAVLQLAKAVNALASAVAAGGSKRPDPVPAKQAGKEASGLDYVKDVKPLALALAKSNRPALLAIYKKLGVTVGTELKPDQFAEAKRLIEEQQSADEEDGNVA